MQIICPSCMVATQVQAILRMHGVLPVQLIEPHLDDPRITVMVNQPISVAQEPTLRRVIQQLAGTRIVG